MRPTSLIAPLAPVALAQSAMALRLRVVALAQATPAGTHRMMTHYLVVVALHLEPEAEPRPPVVLALHRVAAVVVRHPVAVTRPAAVLKAQEQRVLAVPAPDSAARIVQYLSHKSSLRKCRYVTPAYRGTKHSAVQTAAAVSRRSTFSSKARATLRASALSYVASRLAILS